MVINSSDHTGTIIDSMKKLGCGLSLLESLLYCSQAQRPPPASFSFTIHTLHRRHHQYLFYEHRTVKQVGLHHTVPFTLLKLNHVKGIAGMS